MWEWSPIRDAHNRPQPGAPEHWVLEGQNLEGGTFVWGPRRGSEATERGEGVGGRIPPSHGRDFFQNESLKVAFVEHLKTIF